MPAQTTAAVAATEMPALLRQHLTGWAGGSPPPISFGWSPAPATPSPAGTAARSC